jgi:hypothetical protein
MTPQPVLKADDPESVLQQIDEYLAKGRALRDWWVRTYAANSFARKFKLTSTFNRPDESFGFFDEVPYGKDSLRVMGNYQEMLYDRIRGPAKLAPDLAGWIHEQVRQFVLRYFMRISSFRPPEAYAPDNKPDPPDYLRRLSWCQTPEIKRQGFGFKQLYYKLRNGAIGRFSEDDESIIVDLREIGPKYEWILLKVTIFDFRFLLTLGGMSLFGASPPQLAFPLSEASYLVMTSDFITNDENPGPGVAGRYGFGYAFIKNPYEGMIRYGPGEFDAAIELIDFIVQTNGDIRVAMAFVANRPQQLASVSLDPIGWGFKLADFATLGVSSRVLAPVKESIDRMQLKIGAIDPIQTYVGLANLLTGGEASRQLCISLEHLDVNFLVQHFTQHYQTVVGSLLTWRQIDNWLDEARLPDWVVKGRSS